MDRQSAAPSQISSPGERAPLQTIAYSQVAYTNTYDELGTMGTLFRIELLRECIYGAVLAYHCESMPADARSRRTYVGDRSMPAVACHCGCTYVGGPQYARRGNHILVSSYPRRGSKPARASFGFFLLAVDAIHYAEISSDALA